MAFIWKGASLYGFIHKDNDRVRNLKDKDLIYTGITQAFARSLRASGSPASPKVVMLPFAFSTESHRKGASLYGFIYKDKGRVLV